jgi:hypothetical protein
MRPTNGESHEEPIAVERRDDGVRIPSRLLWPLVALVVGGSGSSVAAVLGLSPAPSPATDERAAVTATKVMQIEDAMRAHAAEHVAMRAEQERQGRLLVRIAERLRVRDVERP